MKRKLTAACQGIRKPNLRRSHNRSIKTKEILEKNNPHLSCVGGVSLVDNYLIVKSLVCL